MNTFAKFCLCFTIPMGFACMIAGALLPFRGGSLDVDLAPRMGIAPFFVAYPLGVTLTRCWRHLRPWERACAAPAILCGLTIMFMSTVGWLRGWDLSVSVPSFAALLLVPIGYAASLILLRMLRANLPSARGMRDADVFA